MLPIEVYLLVIILGVVNSARILGIAGVPCYSHQIFYRPIWLELAKHGHHLTLLTTDPMEDAPSNIRQIDLHSAHYIRHEKHNTTNILQKLHQNKLNIFEVINAFHNMLMDVLEVELSHPEVQQLMTNDEEHFDLVMTEFLPLAMSAFSVRFNCPYISIFSIDVDASYHYSLGNHLHPVLYPDVTMNLNQNLNFQQRLLSTIYHGYMVVHQEFFKTKNDNLLIKKYFGEGYPPLNEIIKNVSMVFLNTHPIFESRPLGPRVIRIGGGIHMKKEQKLPLDIKEFLDNNDQDVIYLSFGTNVQSNHIDTNFLKIVLKVFEELPYKIIWKLDKDIPEKSNNVKIFKWLPQQDVLRHKNVKLFITQCGAQSMEEAIMAEVPLLTIPFVADQAMNSFKVVTLGLGLNLDKTTITEKTLKNSIMEIMTNSSYRQNVKKVAKLLLDEPMTGLEKVVWWTEYVIRHKGTKHLWHPDENVPLYQYLLLDVIGFIILVVVALFYIVYKLVKILFGIFKKMKNFRKQKMS